MKFVNSTTIGDILHDNSLLESLDLEILIAHTIKKPREFILAHPEYELNSNYELRITNYARRRMRDEPIAYITGHKEFYGLDFEVNKNTLIPRPETEHLVDLAIELAEKKKDLTIIDVGTGSGNIIISLAKNLENTECYASDISKKALKIAKRNAKKHGVDRKIKFLQGDLMKPIIKKFKLKNSNFNRNSKFEIRNSGIIILANLPYLSEKIYKESSKDVKNFEPKSALYSDNEGLAHYKKLFQQVKLLATSYKLQVTLLIEISPEQKKKIENEIKKEFPDSKLKFKKDLAGKWRLVHFTIRNNKCFFCCNKVAVL